MTCSRCDSQGWVCENHPDKPWDGTSDRADACHCGGAGMPCEACVSTVTFITGCAPNLPWWRALSMTDEEIAAYNNGFLRRETVAFNPLDHEQTK